LVFFSGETSSNRTVQVLKTNRRKASAVGVRVLGRATGVRPKLKRGWRTLVRATRSVRSAWSVKKFPHA